MYKIGVVGEDATVKGFLSLGFLIENAENAGAAKEKVELLKEKGCVIVYITDDLYEKIDTDIYRTDPLFTLIPINTLKSRSNVGAARLKKAVEKAVGADILFGNIE